MNIHLVDGTYELFRAHFAMPPVAAPDGRPVSAVRGIIQTMLMLLREDGVTHVACAFDHVVESFRNDMFDGYKTGAGTPEDLMSQFDLAERAVAALGVVVWPMVEFEADDALATAAEKWRDAPNVEQVVICSPDKDLTQMVHGSQVVCLDRRRKVTLDDAGVRENFGVPPASIPDSLALVRHAADGIPGLRGWGAKSSATILARYGHLEAIPDDPAEWDVAVRGATKLAGTLAAGREEALLYRLLATLDLDAPVMDDVEDLRWTGPADNLEDVCSHLDAPRLAEMA